MDTDIERGIEVMKGIQNLSDMDYYFRMYGKIENYLFPEIRSRLLKNKLNLTDSQKKFLVEFRQLIIRTRFDTYSDYFDGVPTNLWHIYVSSERND
jgi:hypothetical protein